MIVAAEQRRGGIAVHFPRLEITRIEADFAVQLIAGFRTFVDGIDDAEAAVATEVETLAAAENFDVLDHARIQRRGAPKAFERRAAIESRNAIEQ